MRPQPESTVSVSFLSVTKRSCRRIAWLALFLISMKDFSPQAQNTSQELSPASTSSAQEEFARAIKEGPLVNVTPYQYVFESIAVPRADPEEKRLPVVDVQKAVDYLDQGALAWNGVAGCVTCHTNGAYMAYRPALTQSLGKPSEVVRQFFEGTLQKQLEVPKEELLQGLGPTQVIYVANGLAQWDTHVTRALSPQTEKALALMFELQQDNGAWPPPGDCWPPFESDSYQPATLAAIAAATAPGWLANLQDPPLKHRVERLRQYLRTTKPPHDYGRVFLLWAASRMPDLMSESEKQEIIDSLWKHQRPDGGWSIRTFADPEQWGTGLRGPKLLGEPEFSDPPSDGHQTGLVITVLIQAGIPAVDPGIQRGVQWLLQNQRVSGRWWTRSLNTDEWHFITYSGTCFALLALNACDALPIAPSPILAPLE